MRLWDVATGARISTFDGQFHPVRLLTFSPDGSRLASESFDNTVRLWDGATGVQIATLEGHSGTIELLTFSPNGSRLASLGSSDKTVRLWDVATGVRISTLGDHLGPIELLTFSLNGSRLASSGSFDKIVRLWDVATGVRISTLVGHSGPIELLTFSPDSSRLASGSFDKTVILWNVATGVMIATLKGHSGTIRLLTFSPDGSRLASSGSPFNETAEFWKGTDKTVRLWDGIAGVPIATLKGHSGIIELLTFSPDSSRLASGSRNNTRLWDAATGRFLHTLDTLPDWHLWCTVSCGTPISLDESEETSRRYYLQGTLPNNNNRIPLLWFPADTALITHKTFCSKSAAFGCVDCRLIILDLSRLNLHEIG